MKKIIAVIIALLSFPGATMFAQEKEKIDSIVDVIQSRKNSSEFKKQREELGKSGIGKKAQPLIEEQLADSDSLIMWQSKRIGQLSHRVVTLEDSLEAFSLFFFLDNEEKVFEQQLPDYANAPAYLQPHIQLIIKARRALELVAKIEENISRKQKAFNDCEEAKIAGLIADAISADVDELYKVWSEVQVSGMPTFSKAQIDYLVNNVGTPYQKFIDKYFNE